jgi:hypothetical protein
LTLFPPRRETYNLNALQPILILNPILEPTRVLGLVDLRFEIGDLSKIKLSNRIFYNLKRLSNQTK